jgi:hypothetical protein
MKLAHVFLRVKCDVCPSDQILASRIAADREVLPRVRFPYVLIVVVVRRGDNSVSNKEREEETDAKMSHELDLGAFLDRPHELLRAWARDRSRIVDEVGRGHPDTGVDDQNALALFVWQDLDEKLLLFA